MAACWFAAGGCNPPVQGQRARAEGKGRSQKQKQRARAEGKGRSQKQKQMTRAEGKGRSQKQKQMTRAGADYFLSSSLGASTMPASVVIIRPAMDAALVSAMRVTFFGSRMPAATMSS